MAGKFWGVILSNMKPRRYFSHDYPYKQVMRYSTNSPRVYEQIDPNNYVKKKFADLMKWYEEVTGMDEVRFAQNRVLDAEQNFITAQERRREASKNVAAIQVKLKELYGELDTTTRGEERYVQIITQEHRVLKEERRLVEEFQRYEREERDFFSSLSTAVKDSHEKERAQAEKTKYWSIIGSIIGTVLGIAGSSINNEIKMKQLRRLVQESLVNKANSSNNVPEALTKHEKELSVLVNQMKTVTNQPNDLILGRLNELVLTLDNKLLENEDKSSNNQVIIDNFKRQELKSTQHFDELKALFQSHSLPQIEGDHIVVMPVGLEERLTKQNRETQQVVVIASIIVILLPLVMNYVGFN